MMVVLVGYLLVLVLVLVFLLQAKVVANLHTDDENNSGFVQQPNNVIPIIDVSPWTTITTFNAATVVREDQIQVAMAVGKACRDIGFFVIRNHGVNETTMTRAWDVVRSFFDLPLSQKRLHQTNDEEEYPYGYEQSERLVLGKELDRNLQNDNSTKTAEEEEDVVKKKLTPDLKETFSIGPNNPRSGMPERRYPNIPGMKEALDDCYLELEKLALTLLRIFAVALDLPDNWFDDKMDHHMCALRSLNYPAPPSQQKQQQQQQSPNDPLVIRAGAHTDYGPFTILKSGGPGLQAKKDTDHGGWVDVPQIPDTLIINLGDLMQRWTNDRWVSTLHRVILPPGEGPHQRRQSMAFFVNINGDAEVTPLPTCVDADHPAKYGSITAREHLMAKHLASMGKTANKMTKNDEL